MALCAVVVCLACAGWCVVKRGGRVGGVDGMVNTTSSVRVLTIFLIVSIVAVIFKISRGPKDDGEIVRFVGVTNLVAEVVTTSTPPTEVAEKLVVQTNGLVRVLDVGGTVSYQSVSSKTSAPVAPENPYLNNK